MHVAVGANSVEAMEVLLHYGAWPAVKDKEGNTPIHHAAYLGHEECLRCEPLCLSEET